MLFRSQIETIDISLVDDMPTVLNVLHAIAPNFVIGKAWMATEFRLAVSPESLSAYKTLLPSLEFEAHIELKRRVPSAIGLIRTADTTPYSNVILESA